MQSGARTADLPRNKSERDQAARVIGAVHMLADAHAPENDGGARSRIEPRNFTQCLCRNTADRLHFLGREFLDPLLQIIEAFGVARDILVVGEALGDDGVDHCVQHRDITAGLERQIFVSIARQALPAWIHHDQLGAALSRILDEGSRHRVIHGRIGADHDDDLGIHRGREWRGHCARVQPFHQRGD